MFSNSQFPVYFIHSGETQTISPSSLLDPAQNSKSRRGLRLQIPDRHKQDQQTKSKFDSPHRQFPSLSFHGVDLMP